MNAHVEGAADEIPVHFIAMATPDVPPLCASLLPFAALNCRLVWGPSLRLNHLMPLWERHLSEFYILETGFALVLAHRVQTSPYRTCHDDYLDFVLVFYYVLGVMFASSGIVVGNLCSSHTGNHVSFIWVSNVEWPYSSWSVVVCTVKQGCLFVQTAMILSCYICMLARN